MLRQFMEARDARQHGRYDQKDKNAATLWPHSSLLLQWHFFLLVLLVDAVRAAFPSVVVMPKMLGSMVAMTSRRHFSALVADCGSGMFFAGFAGGCSSRCVPSVCRQARRQVRQAVCPRCSCRWIQNLGCGGDFTGAVLGQGACVFHRRRGPDSAFCLKVPLLQLIFKNVDFPVVALRLSHGPDHAADP